MRKENDWMLLREKNNRKSKMFEDINCVSRKDASGSIEKEKKKIRKTENLALI